MLYMGERSEREQCSALCGLSATPSATYKHSGHFRCWFLSGWVCVCSRTLWVSPKNSPVSLGVSPASASTPTGVFSQWFEAYFPELEPWVVWSVSLPSCSSRFIYVWMWGLGVRQPPSCHESSPPGCPSPPLLLVWMNGSSLSPWLSDFHSVWFSVSSGCFLFLNCCCPSFGCARRHNVSTYASVLAGSLIFFLKSLWSKSVSNYHFYFYKSKLHLFLSGRQNIYFLVCHRILVITLCVPWD